MRPILVLNPRHDLAFVQAAEALVEGGTGSPGELEAALRRDFPRVVVRPRDLSDERLVMWYVYREGHWVNGRHHDGDTD